MKISIKTLSAIACICASLFTSCDKAEADKGSGKVQAAKLSIELQKYYKADGAIGLKYWEAGDKVAAFNADAPTATTNTGSPIYTGNQTSSFTIGVTDPKEGNTLLAYYPSSADVTCAPGEMKAKIATTQDGENFPSPIFVGSAKYTGGNSSLRMEMAPFWCVVYASLQMGDYSITKAVIASNNGEKIAGDVSIKGADLNVTGSSSEIVVNFAQPRDCRLGTTTFAFIVAPVTLSKGFTITYHTEDGKTFKYTNEEAITFELGNKFDTNTSNDAASQVLVCGDNMIYLIDVNLAVSKGYKNAILWQWNAKDYSGKVGLTANNMIRLDDAKPVDGKKKIIATSSKGYAVLIDKETGNVIWFSNCSTNAHSAELLPNNRVAVACSEGGDLLQIFDVDKSNKVLFSDSLPHGHGVVWNEKTQRLYAIGTTSLKIYSLKDWSTSAPKLTLEKVVATNPYVTGLHDLTLVDDNTLLLAGNKAALYNISANTFTNIGIFSSSTSLKSVNYNPNTGECWFTDPTAVEIPELTWASHTIRYTSDMHKSYETKNFKVEDLNCYKVRVYNW